MTAAAQRAAGLAAVALVAAVIALALTHRDLGAPAAKRLPEAVGWTTGLAAPYGPSRGQRRTSCGRKFTSDLLGIAHPTLPCGAKIYISYHGRQVLTQVVDRGPKVPGRTFDITIGLARELGLRGTQRVRWAWPRAT